MSILDDAIREHLELKRAHGADEAEVKRLEDEAFGPPGRPEEPDPLAEAPTEFMATPEAGEAAEAEGGRRINIADLQEAPPPEAAQEGEPLVPAEDAIQAAEPAEEEPAAEHDAVIEAPEPGHSTEERHAIAEQPTEFFDVAAEMGTEDAPPAEAPISEEPERPEAQAEPAAGPAEPEAQVDYDPDTGHEDVLEDTPDFLENAPEDDELWFEQKPPKDFDFDD